MIQYVLMSQFHGIQNGTFHVTTNTRGKVPWCTHGNIPQILIDNLVMTRNVLKAELYAFCILPDHVHILLNPGKKGLSAFMHSFKRNSAININQLFRSAGSYTRAPKPGHEAGVYEPRLRDGYYWQHGFFDERIRDSVQRSTVLHYIQNNPIKHALVTDIADWKWSSVHYSHLLDPMEVWID